ncbi:cobalt ECF transporter T component CbiQ [Anaerosalibacter sp. Marseille-P3206]|uniref:cobalt ECF transporter T component CbiQ n=1 Tax=Anaerosalibacter sp. Marseille-P3206 TaxID=1871005 RepID=UPI00190E8BD7|nr:cobalt ECF transporter T component CbiQ [Anaerosalibacter sp. Marseille-P3206]
MLVIDKYAYTNKIVNVNPMAKFIFAIGALILAVGLNNFYLNIIIFLIMFLSTTVVAKIPIKNYLKLYLIPSVFLIISILTILISKSSLDVFIWSIRIGKSFIGIKSESLNEVIIIIARVFASISSTFFIALTIPINQLIVVFKKLRVPGNVVELIILIYRSIFIFLEEMMEIYNIQEMKFGYCGMKNSYRSLGLLIKCLFVRVLQKYEDMVISLETKLYDGEFKIG